MPIIKDQASLYSGKVGDQMAQTFPGGISSDQRIFIVTDESFMTPFPNNTMSERCENFLFARTGQDKGGILYGDTVYTIERIFSRPILGTIAARYFILAVAQKRATG